MLLRPCLLCACNVYQYVVSYLITVYNMMMCFFMYFLYLHVTVLCVGWFHVLYCVWCRLVSILFITSNIGLYHHACRSYGFLLY
jgi:hypothetical protein